MCQLLKTGGYAQISTAFDLVSDLGSSKLIGRGENLPKTDHPDLNWLCFLASDPTVDEGDVAQISTSFDSVRSGPIGRQAHRSGIQ
jgi:hypothetical protein